MHEGELSLKKNVKVKKNNIRQIILTISFTYLILLTKSLVHLCKPGREIACDSKSYSHNSVEARTIPIYTFQSLITNLKRKGLKLANERKFYCRLNHTFKHASKNLVSLHISYCM